jgi:hypothetical protein
MYNIYIKRDEKGGSFGARIKWEWTSADYELRHVVM